MEGFAGHLVSEYVYLRSPDGIGSEVHAGNTPGERIRKGVPVAVDTLPLDLDGKAVTPSPLPPSAEIGRTEGLRGSQRVIAFYRRLGMAVT